MLLKLVFETSQLTKWSHIARRLQEEHGVRGRNGKQCKERYSFHHLDISLTLIPLTPRRSGATPMSSACLTFTMSLAISGPSLALNLKEGTSKSTQIRQLCQKSFLFQAAQSPSQD